MYNIIQYVQYNIHVSKLSTVKASCLLWILAWNLQTVFKFLAQLEDIP